MVCFVTGTWLSKSLTSTAFYSVIAAIMILNKVVTAAGSEGESEVHDHAITDRFHY